MPTAWARSARELGARTAAFDVTDFDQLARFFDELEAPVDHVLVTGPGPYYALLEDFAFDEARRDVESHLLLPILIAKLAARLRPRLAAVHGWDRRAPDGAGNVPDRGAHRRDAGADEEPRARGSRRSA